MRKILWTLAASTAMSASVSGTFAEERFGPQAGTASTGVASTRTMSIGSGRTPTGIDARPFPGGAPVPRAGALTEASASELFRRDTAIGASTPAAATSHATQPQTGADALDQFQRVSGISTGRPDDVVHAEFERLPGQRDSIEQISSSQAAEFPAQFDSATDAGASADPFAQSTLPATTDTTFVRQSPPVTRTGGSRLVEPISTTGPARTTTQFAGAGSTRPSGRAATFTRPVTRDVVQAGGQVETGFSNRVTPISAVEVETTAPVITPSRPEPLSAIGEQVRSGPQSPTVSVEWVTRSSINVGQECVCDLIVKNNGLIAARDVEVNAHFPTSVRLVGTQPQPSVSEEYVGWHFPELQPGEEKTISVTLIPTTRGDLDTRADVRFSGSAATRLTVSEPLLDVSVSGPEKVLVGEPASQTVVVTNPGSGVATNVEIEAVLPPGLEHARGERLIMEVGSLNPGETRSVRLALAAIKGGNQVLQVQARGDGDLVQNVTSEVYVVAPSLVATIDGPGLRYLGRNAIYSVQVRNDGEIAVENVRMMHKVPEGFEVIETDHGAQFDRPNRIVNWFVGRLQPGQTGELKVTLRADQIGSFTHFVRASSEHGAISDGQFTTQVEGTSSLAMEIRDLEDPVEVGGETAYEIVVRNDGSAAARAVSLACEIPAGVEVLTAQGPVDSIRQRDLVTFNPVLELAPGNSVTYRVHVRGIDVGHHRLRARLTSDSNPEPIQSDEVTRFYGE
jgi:uncharacterized repeat protein (TIGR01451 family)